MNEAATNGTGDSISTTLLGGVRRQDSEAWRRLVFIYGPIVFDWCRRAGLQPSDAADVGQEVFRGVAKSLPSFRRENSQDTFVGWLRSITRYKILDFKRAASGRPPAVGGSSFQRTVGDIAARSEPSGVDEADCSIPDNESDAGQIYHRALELIRQEFKERTWRAFWETAVLERPTAEVAAHLEMTCVAVRKAKSRVLHRLRSEFPQQFEP